MVVKSPFAIGAELPSVDKHLTIEDIYRFEGIVEDRGRNFHNDPAVAREIGFAAPIASAMMQLAFIHQLMEQAFGEGFDRGGQVKARWVHPIYAGDRITVSGTVTEQSVEGDRIRHTVDVRCVNQNGVKTAVATASALVP